MSIRRSRSCCSSSPSALPGLWPVAPPPPARAQAVDVFLNVTGGGARKLNIAIPEFTVTTGADPTGGGKLLATVAGADLTFSGLFSVVAATGAIPANNPEALRHSWTEFAAAGAHAGVHGLLALRGDRAEVEMRLYDLTTPDHRLIGNKKFELPVAQLRRLGHKVADEVVLQFTGEPGIADTKIAYVVGPRGAKEIVMADYDGAAAAGDEERLDQSVAGVEPRRTVAGLHLLQAGLSRPLPRVPVRAAPRPVAGRLRRHQHLAGLQPRRPEPGDDAQQGRQPRDLRAEPGQRRHAPAHPPRRHRHRAELGADRRGRSRSSPTAPARRTST